jgi:hypothetical protein
MVYLRSVKSCSGLDYIPDEDIRQELNIIHITANIDSYRKQWGKTFTKNGWITNSENPLKI